ncbi:MAG TPA: STAS/SEC14 domain-containing protein [Herpetosiphonaceae bacterium]
METQEIVTRTSRVRMEADMVARVTIFSGAQQTLADAKENIQALEELSQGRPFRALTDIRQMTSQSREAREFYSDPSHTQSLVAVAILVGSPVSRLIGNFFMGFNKSSTPTRLFTSEADAIAWLKEFPLSNDDQNH